MPRVELGGHSSIQDVEGGEEIKCPVLSIVVRASFGPLPAHWKNGLAPLEPLGPGLLIHAEDHTLPARAQGIPKDPGPLDPATSTVKQGVVGEEVVPTGGGEEADEEKGGEGPELALRPRGGANGAMIGVVGPLGDQPAAPHHPGHRATHGTDDPGGEELLEGGKPGL